LRHRFDEDVGYDFVFEAVGVELVSKGDEGDGVSFLRMSVGILKEKKRCGRVFQETPRLTSRQRAKSSSPSVNRKRFNHHVDSGSVLPGGILFCEFVETSSSEIALNSHIRYPVLASRESQKLYVVSQLTA